MTVKVFEPGEGHPSLDDVMMHEFYEIINQLHIWAGVVALFIGPAQFIRAVRQRWIRFHRMSGRIYVTAVLISSPLALIVSFHSPLPLAVAGTAIQSVLWFVVTLQAYRFIKARRIDEHRRCMILSYCLTLTAPVVRLGIVVMEKGLGLHYQEHFETYYPLLVWISFIPFASAWMLTRPVQR